MATLDAEWHLSNTGEHILTNNGSIKDKKEIFQQALNTDLKEICSPVLSKEPAKEVFSKVVLQIQKIKNISAPKANEDSQAAPRMLKLSLTDGDGYVQALEVKNIGTLSHKTTPPGTKILVQNAKYYSGYLLLSPECCTVLGGRVPNLVEKWELAKSTLPSKRRYSSEDGPPPWVHFGVKIKTNIQDDNFASLSSKAKDSSKENPEFEQQRLEAIAEASTGAVKKVFGGRVKQNVQPVQNYQNRNNQKQRRDQPKGKGKKCMDDEEDVVEKPLKPTNKVSLFSFLEDKLPVNENPQHTKYSNQFPSDRYRPNESYKQNNMQSYQTSNNQKPSARQSNLNSFKHQNSERFEKPYPSYKEQNRQNENASAPINDIKLYHGNSNQNITNPIKFYHSENSKQRSSNYMKSQDDASQENNIKFYHSDISKKVPANYSNDSRQGSSNNAAFHQDNSRKGGHNSGKYNSSYQQNTQITYNQGYQQNNYQQANYQRNNQNSYQQNQSTYQQNSYQQQNHNNYKQNTQPTKPVPTSTMVTSNVDSTVNSIDVESVTQNLGKVSLNSQFASRSLRQHLNLSTNKKNEASTPPIMQSGQSGDSSYKIGDVCLAKYWEDGKFYEATITAITDKTFAVKFKGYGNIEEILKTDCQPLDNKQYNQQKRYNSRQYSGKHLWIFGL
ncbi:unnamed protein product [Acanthoscelides obtectus]|uniref:Survival of motor neuron-related-splicing factor 30 n=1 Tax=Acanthoscelides obtectus TaxID=200917 RepID=A0A9P0KZT4_ACAOB|nr:unnamed protein product [Acanthoscelides obtectus]CAK1678339.1 Tudor domain-containing protein 3 [Acanthoscelides obtectus]